jgi:hypothetical protein
MDGFLQRPTAPANNPGVKLAAANTFPIGFYTNRHHDGQRKDEPGRGLRRLERSVGAPAAGTPRQAAPAVRTRHRDLRPTVGGRDVRVR